MRARASKQLCYELDTVSEKLLREPLEAQPLGQLRRKLREEINARLTIKPDIEEPEVMLIEYILLSILDDMWPNFSGVVSEVVPRKNIREMSINVASSLKDLSASLKKGDFPSCYRSCSSILSTLLQILQESE